MTGQSCRAAVSAAARARGIGEDHIATVRYVETLGSEGRRNDGSPGGHFFEDFQTSPAADSERHDENRGVFQIVDDRRNGSGDLDGVRGEPEDARLWGSADDPENGVWNLRQHHRPDVAAEIFDGVHVRFPIHRPKKHHGRTSRRRAGRGAILRQIDACGHDGNPRLLGHRRHRPPIAFGHGDDAREAPDRRPFIARHLGRLDREGNPPQQTPLVRRLTSPENRLDVVLKQHAGTVELSRKIE